MGACLLRCEIIKSALTRETTYLGLRVDEEPVASLCVGCKYEDQWAFVNRWFVISRTHGFEILYGPERVVEAIFLHSFGRGHGYAQFAGELPNGIKFGDPPERWHLPHPVIGPET